MQRDGRRLLRRMGRACWLAAGLSRTGVLYFVRVKLRRASQRSAARLAWFQLGCERVLRVLHVAVRSSGPVPNRGFLVANHLSYLDILVLGTVAPGVFVAKSEVRRWPVFGWFARLMGTLFAERARRLDVARLTAAIEDKLNAGLLVTLFPEGTSSDGRTVLPFKPSLLEPAARGGNHPVAAAHLSYVLHDAGAVADDVCYWRDMTFGPHVWNLLGKRSLSASIVFRAVPRPAHDRKELARQLHSEVASLGGVAQVQTF